MDVTVHAMSTALCLAPVDRPRCRPRLCLLLPRSGGDERPVWDCSGRLVKGSKFSKIWSPIQPISSTSNPLDATAERLDARNRSHNQRICANGEPADHCPGVPFIGQRHCASRSSRGRQGQQGFISTSRMWWRTQIMLRRRASRCVYIFIFYALISMSYDMSACFLFSLSLSRSGLSS